MATHDSYCFFYLEKCQYLFSNQRKPTRARRNVDLPVPSGPPRAYNISVGWKTSEVCLGIKDEGAPRNGKLESPVGILVVESGGSPYVKDRTTTR